MTGVGHSLTGLSIAALGHPVEPSWRRRALLVALYAGAANLPDLPVPLWGHHRYHVSHSIIVNLVLMLGCALVLALAPRLRRGLGGWRGAICLGLAWCSHFALDGMYNHGRGVAVLWPVSDTRLVLALPWFRTLTGPRLDSASLHIFAVEAAFFGALLLLCVALRLTVGRLARASRRSAPP